MDTKNKALDKILKCLRLAEDSAASLQEVAGSASPLQLENIG